jgi:single-stranded-DNA-specific exonuclease
VADVAVQTGDTRYLLQRGLAALRATQRAGLLKVMELAEVSPAEITEQHIGFALGPRLNALGRLGDANEAVTLLTSTDAVEVEVLARRLEGLNSKRKSATSQVYNAALSMVESDRSLLDHGALVLSHDQWPGGVIGIAASRLAERFNRPVVLITTPLGGIGRGSARSVAGCDITAALAQHADMLRGWGGHTMAAGLTIDVGNIPGFRQALGYTVRRMMGETPPEAALMIDAYVSLGAVSLALAGELDRLAPFGPGNPPVTLATRDLRVRSRRALGRGGDHLRLVVADDAGAEREVIWWQSGDSEVPAGRFDLAYTIRVSHFSGAPEVLVEWLDARVTEVAAAEVAAVPAITVAGDYRQAHDPLATLVDLRGVEPGLVVWCEADQQVEGVTRAQLVPTQALAVWTIPPAQDVWQAALAQALPERVYLFGVDPGMDVPGAFITRLAGLAKTVVRRGAPAAITELAAAAAQSEAAVRAGLRLLAAEGHITVQEQPGGLVNLGAPGTADAGAQAQARREVEWLLTEAAAYRGYWRSVQRLPGLSRG